MLEIKKCWVKCILRVTVVHDDDQDDDDDDKEEEGKTYLYAAAIALFVNVCVHLHKMLADFVSRCLKSGKQY